MLHSTTEAGLEASTNSGMIAGKPLDPDSCWRAVLSRDVTFDGRFVFAVVTTGVYCRPSCPSRHALRRNVRFFAGPDEAERAGFRPCLRCQPRVRTPQHTHTAQMAQLCTYIEQHADESVSLQQLSEIAGLSPYHLLRVFRAVVGLTPKQYHDACRARNFKNHLREGKSVTDAIYEAGYGSSSRAYEKAQDLFGMTPAEYRHGGRNTWIYHATVATPVGLMLVAATDRGLCAVEFGDVAKDLVDSLRKEYPEAELRALAHPYPESFRRWITGLQGQVEGHAPRRPAPLDITASDFQMRVYQYLRTIPSGETRSYGEVAEALGDANAARAVANACASNPVALAVPCHRVVHSDGNTKGYRWGDERKLKLLDAERQSKVRKSKLS
jgi:AraC family transcriptional regulator of adaptative response/methylated-DNA-[protein]-cysteine methyltransferase